MIKKLCMALIAVIISMPITALAAENSCVFFAPQSMNEANEIIVPIYTKNLPQDNDGLCGCEFQFAYNTEQFTLKTDESGRPLLGTNETMLVQDTDIIEASVNGDIVSVSYVDFSGENISVPNAFGGEYVDIKVFMWNSLLDMQPRCPAFS